jgi:D-alanyl-D-alanine carboxypeptidase
MTIKRTTKRLAQTVASILALTLPCAAQNPPTPSPASQQLTAWLAAYDGTDWNAYLDFLQKSFVVPPGGGYRDPTFRDRTGGFDLKKIEQETPTQITALLADRSTDDFSRVTVEVEAAEPHRILHLKQDLVERPAEFAIPHLSDAELITALRNKLDAATAADKFSGAVLVGHHGKPTFAQAYGMADRDRNIPNTLKTTFSIASMNKMFTAVATMQLVQAGKLSLDDPLNKYLPDYPNKDLAAKVTIAELLTNTGGTGNIWGPEYDAHRADLRTLQDYINLYGSRPLRFEPGSRWEYSNYGFILLGAVIQKVSGEDYYAYISNHVYRVAGMSSTGSGIDDKTVPHRAIDYTKMGSPTWIPNGDTAFRNGSPAGGGYSTVGDMLSFANTLQQNELLHPQFTKLLTTPQVKNPFGMDAYGFGVQTINGNECFGHNGSARGVNGDLEICAASGYTVVVLANIDPPAAEELAHFIINRLPAPKAR